MKIIKTDNNPPKEFNPTKLDPGTLFEWFSIHNNTEGWYLCCRTDNSNPESTGVKAFRLVDGKELHLSGPLTDYRKFRGKATITNKKDSSGEVIK